MSGRADESGPGSVGPDHYRMLSLAFVVRSADADFAEALRWHLAPFHRSVPEPDALPIDLSIEEADPGAEAPWYSLFISGERRFRDHRLVEVLGHALWAIHAMVPNLAEDMLFLHSGAVSRHQEAVLLPAGMEQGKSSLVLALLQQGFAYLSDELGVLDPVSGHAVAFPKLITLDEASFRFFPELLDRLADRSGLSAQLVERYVRPEDVGATVGAPGPVRWLVFPSSNRAGPPRLSPLPRAEAVERMATHCFNLYRFQERGVLLLGGIAREADAYRIEGGSPRERAELLAESLS